MKILHSIGRDPRRPPRRIVVVTSGRIRSGKTALARSLAPWLHAEVVHTKDILLAEYGAHPEVRLRKKLQDLGERLDRETDGTWVAAAAGRRMANIGPTTPVIVDSVRIERQIDHLRAVPGVRLVHAHLRARRKTLEARYTATKPADETELPSYADVEKNSTEARVDELRKLTRLRFNTTLGGAPLFAVDVAALVWALRALDLARNLAVALLAGSTIAIPFGAGLAWFWLDHLSLTRALLLSCATLVFFGILAGSALTRLSPIERDEATPTKELEALPPPVPVAQPSGPEVVKARAPVPSVGG